MNYSRLLDALCCPKCKGQLWVDAPCWFGPLQNGKLRCRNCEVDFPVENGIPRFVQSDSYVSSFSLEWAKHARTQLDSVSGLTVARDVFFERTGFTREELKGKLVLDAGCGIGRFTEVAQKFGARVVGVDMSFSVNQAYENVGTLPNVDIIQADLLDLPLKPESFDMVFSLGVLHHTSNAQEAFMKLAPLVKKGGKMAIWVYANDGLRQKAYNAVAAFYRAFTTRMPQERLYNLCGCAVPLYRVHKLPVVGYITRALIPTSMEPQAEWRVLDTFDWFSPKFQSKHTYKEVEAWFEYACFGEVRKLPFPTSVNGTKRG